MKWDKERLYGKYDLCPTWLRILISSVPLDGQEFWYGPNIAVPISPYLVYIYLPPFHFRSSEGRGADALQPCGQHDADPPPRRQDGRDDHQGQAGKWWHSLPYHLIS